MFTEIQESLRQLYLEDARPWLVGFSGGNVNSARVQHFIHYFAPQGMAGFVLANGRMSSNQPGEGDVLENQPRALATLRDTLLPKLLSGELSVANAEQIEGGIA